MTTAPSPTSWARIDRRTSAEQRAGRKRAEAVLAELTHHAATMPPSSFDNVIVRRAALDLMGPTLTPC